MKPDYADFIKATIQMRAIPFFPEDLSVRAAIAEGMARFVNTTEELNWLVVTAVNSIRDWSKGGGLPELRGIFCSRFVPADGQESSALTTAGFTAEDRIQRHQERVREENERRLAYYEQEARRLGEKADPFPLPDLKRIH